MVVDELVKATIGHQKRADFSDLVGLWKPDPGFDQITDSQRRNTQGAYGADPLTDPDETS